MRGTAALLVALVAAPLSAIAMWWLLERTLVSLQSAFPPLDAAEAIAEAVWPVLGPVLAFAINALVIVPTVLTAHRYSRRPGFVVISVIAVATLFMAAMLRAPALSMQDRLVDFLITAPIVGAPVAVMTFVSYFTWRKITNAT